MPGCNDKGQTNLADEALFVGIRQLHSWDATDAVPGLSDPDMPEEYCCCLIGLTRIHT